MRQVYLALAVWAAMAPDASGTAPKNSDVSRPRPGNLPDLAENVDTSKDDLSTDGPCKDMIEKYCPETKEGDGAIAHCLRDSVKAARARREDSPLTHECAKDLRGFFFKVMKHELPEQGPLQGMKKMREGMAKAVDRAFWVDPVRGFREACAKDVEEWCPDMRGPRAMHCLKEHKEKLSDNCKSKVFRLQEMQAEDMTLDKEFYEACQVDLNDSECKDAPPVRRKACLSLPKHRETLSEKCKAAIFSKEKEESEDIRLNKDLMSTCSEAVKTFCKDIEFGEARMLRCLWENVASNRNNKDGEHDECAEKVMRTIGRQVSDYRLDFRVRTKCAQDVDKHCASEKEMVDKMPVNELFDSDGVGKSGKVLHCLKEKIEELEPECSEEMRRVARIQSVHAELDPHLQQSCQEDLKQFCEGEPADKHHFCLRRHFKELSPECKQAELTQGRMERGRFMMKPQIKQACEQAMQEFCKSFGKRGLQCLQDHMHDNGFPNECREALTEDLEASNHDWKLKFGISTECQEDVMNNCNKELHEPGGSVLRCLSGALADDKIVKPGCKQEVERYAKQGAEDIKVLPLSYQACKSDLEQWCNHILPGQGRLHACLLRKIDDLSAECRAAEFENQANQVKSLRASPEGQSACGPVAEKVCPGIEDGPKKWACLKGAMRSPDMTTECMEVLRRHTKIKNTEFFLNPKLVEACKADSQQLCPEALEAATAKDFTSKGRLISCMIEKREQIVSPECKAGVLRRQAERAADASVDPDHQDVCASDIEKYCKVQQEAAKHPRGAGLVHKCLQEHIAELSDPRCVEKEKQYMQMASEDTRLNFPIKESCGAATERWCKDIPNGEGRVTLCLLKHMHDNEMEPECKKALALEQAKRATSLRFNPILRKLCGKELTRLQEEGKCSKQNSIVTAMLPGGNIDCLTDHKDDIQDADCKSQVFQVLQMQSADLRAKPRMYDACKEDLMALCPGVEPGGARGHQCLRDKIGQVQNTECKQMVLQVQQRDNKSASLNFNVRRYCANEKNAFCQDVAPGSSRLLVCLMSHRNETGFSPECASALTKVDVKDLLPKINKFLHNNPMEKKMEELKHWIEAHRGFAEEHGTILLGGTVGFVAILTAWVSWCVLRGRIFSKGGYTVVVPKGDDSKEAEEVQLTRRRMKGDLAA